MDATLFCLIRPKRVLWKGLFCACAITNVTSGTWLFSPPNNLLEIFDLEQ